MSVHGLVRYDNGTGYGYGCGTGTVRYGEVKRWCTFLLLALCFVLLFFWPLLRYLPCGFQKSKEATTEAIETTKTKEKLRVEFPQPKNNFKQLVGPFLSIFADERYRKQCPRGCV